MGTPQSPERPPVPPLRPNFEQDPVLVRDKALPENPHVIRRIMYAFHASPSPSSGKRPLPYARRLDASISKSMVHRDMITLLFVTYPSARRGLPRCARMGVAQL